MMRRIGLLLPLVLLAACGPASQPGANSSPDGGAGREVAVAAASDLKFALDELIAEFQKSHPGIQVKPTYGSSGNFFAQLSNRAPFDVYLSADIEYPRRLAAAGHTVAGSEFGYARGQIVVWVRNESPLDVAARGAGVLVDPAVQKIAIANPEHAPYGRAAEAMLKTQGVYDQVKGKLVLGENIAQTAQFVESGAADVGILALSLATAPALQDKGRYWLVPAEAYPALEQGGVVLSWTKDREAAEQFRAFITSAEGRAVLNRYGFLPPGD